MLRGEGTLTLFMPGRWDSPARLVHDVLAWIRYPEAAGRRDSVLPDRIRDQLDSIDYQCRIHFGEAEPLLTMGPRL
jgi:hypothetical protein